MSQLITRREALRHCAMFEKSRQRILMIQAQAGQGKTVLGTQFDEISHSPFAWVTCTRPDSAPRSLFDKVLRSLGDTLPNFSKTAVTQAVRQQLSSLEFVDIAAGLIGSELGNTNQPVVLLLDDVHLINDSVLAKKFLLKLVEQSPALVKFVIITRIPLTFGESPLFLPGDTLTIDHSLLAFSREEVETLYNDALGTPVNGDKINQLLQATEGWIAGLKLLHGAGDIQDLMHAENKAAMGMFFEELIVPALTPGEQRTMAMLALLDELPKPLFESEASNYLIHWLEDLVAKNCFARVREENGVRTFRLHHIFQEYLQSQADVTVTDEEKFAFWARVGNWYIDNGQTVHGLDAYACGEEWELLDKALKDHGLPLLVSNYHDSFMDLFSRIPKEIIRDHPWISFVYSSALFHCEPTSSLAAIEWSQDLFRKKREPFGELLALCSLMNYHFMISGEFGRKTSFLHRTTELYEQLEPCLPDNIRALAAQALALGGIYYDNHLELDKVKRYIAISEQHTPPEVKKTDPWVIVTGMLLLGQLGHINQALDDISELFALTTTPWISPAKRFSTLVINANFLHMSGQISAYGQVRDMLRKKWPKLLAGSYLGAFFTVWDLDLLIHAGRYEEAAELASSTAQSNSGLINHILEQLVHYEMLAYAHLGQFDRMETAMKKALRLRARAGGIYFIHLTHCLVMGSLYLAGRHSEADRIYEKCSHYSGEVASCYHTPMIHSYKAANLIARGRDSEAAPIIDTMLQSMIDKGNTYFFGWSPKAMQQVLGLAIAKNIHADFARKLARGKMRHDILDDGTWLPLLTIHVIGTVRLTVGTVDWTENDMPPAWTHIFLRLATASGNVVDVETMQAELWPGQEPSASRAKFDTMLFRLRKEFSSVFGSDTAKHYLYLKNRKLTLTHCMVDTDIAARYAHKGRACLADGKNWQAHTAFSGMARWIGPTFQNTNQKLTLPDAVKGTLLAAMKQWAGMLDSPNTAEQALHIVNKALEIAPINDTLQRQRHRLLVCLKEPAEAHLGLQEYRRTLKAHEFLQEEIDLIIDNLLMEHGES